MSWISVLCTALCATSFCYTSGIQSSIVIQYEYILHRASYFSSTATDKMYSVVGAAKALYDRLGDIGESSIDGDAFLDLWIYVIIKANIKDLVSLCVSCIMTSICEGIGQFV